MWESDIKGKDKNERYYGVSGCVIKVLEELYKEVEEAGE